MPLTSQDEGIAKNNNMTLFIGSAIYVANLLFYGYPIYRSFLFSDGGVTKEIIHDYLSLQNSLFLLSTPFITLAVAAMFFAIFVWSNRRKKTTEYIPPKMMRWIIDLLVKFEIHEKFEYEKKEDANGIIREWKKRERIEGQAALSLGVFLLFMSVLPITLIPPFSPLYGICFTLYLLISLFGFLYFIMGGNLIHAMQKDFGTDDSDANNNLQESFLQCEDYKWNQYSVNLPTEFMYEGKVHHGWINVVNPFRATQVLGTPGSGKSYAVINEFIRQHLAKNFTMYCYDFKFPDLSLIVYNHMLWHKEEFRLKYGREPRFCVINFDDPRKTYRCNPIEASSLQDITYAYDTAYTIMLNLNKSWAQKQGDFFVESPINYLTSCIWYLKKVAGGKYCSLPHVVELVNSKYVDAIPLMSTIPELNNYMAAFFEAWEGGAQDQLQGQIASVRIPLSRISSPELYWVMSANDFTLDLNNPEDPKVLCVGNNPEKKDINATALGLYNGRIVKTINKKHQHPISLIIDELPTMYFRGLDNLIATARSNKVAVVLGFQDFSQLKRDYGDKDATAIINTIGNTFSGLVTGETAQSLEKQFGRNKQKRKSVSYSDNGESYSISEQNDTLIPASKIATLTQGTFVGTVSDDFGQEIEEKRFHAKIIIDNKLVKEQEKRYHPLPTLYSFDNASVAKKLCERVVEFLNVPENFIAEGILQKKGLPSRRNFEVMLKSGFNAENVDKVIDMLFGDESQPERRMVVATFYTLGRGHLQSLMVHEGELQAAANTLLSQIRKGGSSESIVKEFVRVVAESIVKFYKALSEWIELEKATEHDDRVESIYQSIIDYRKFILDEVENIDLRDLPMRIADRNHRYVSSVRSILNNYVSLKQELQAIRDEEMHDVLNKNADKIRRDIQELIQKGLVEMYYTHRDLWRRRLLANKLDESQEMVRLGMDDELEKRKQALQQQQNNQQD